MPIRSVSELLPRPFSELTVGDVPTILEAVGEERESLFFERKQQVTSASLAKSCSAFANTFGGLLLVGIADETDQLVGVEPVAEPQVWVKDVLRGHVLPLPPFRARSLPIDDEHGLVLVLVEESSSTPHLITRQGAIYVRNPGSSDPVPIQDQRRLLDLFERGERSRARAVERAGGLATRAGLPSAFPQFGVETFVLVPTGTSSEFERALLLDDPKLELLQAPLGGPRENRRNDFRLTVWEQNGARVERSVQPGDDAPWREALQVWRDGALVFHRGEDHERDKQERPITWEELEKRLSHYLVSAREVLLALGAHGDIRFVYATGDRTFYAPGRVDDLEGDIVIADWTTLESDDELDKELVGRILAELQRAVGIGPSPVPTTPG
jgi:hypothetical protein